MNSVEFATKLRELRSATSLARARMLADDLRPHAGRVDAVLRKEFSEAMERHGLGRPTIAGTGLLPGETWLLLYEPPQNGCAVRVRASYENALSKGDEGFAAEVRRAHRGLLFSAARACRKLERDRPPSLDVDVPYGTFEVQGSSLGLSVAIATLSATLGRAPSSTTAGSAQVDEEGRLREVEHLAEKLDALHRSWPEVTRVVVATRQKLPEGYTSPVDLMPCDSLSNAIAFFGLTLDDLPFAPLGDFCVRVDRFRADNGEAHDAREWARLSAIAWEASSALMEHDPESSTRAALWAALFAVHSGDPNAAGAFLRRATPAMTDDFPELRVLQLITSATNEIDAERFEEAVALADRAVELCDSLEKSDRRQLFGQALGTQGRALMHGGDLERAEAALRRALKHHLACAPGEAPRSACYLATCLRLAGRPRDALIVVNEAIATAEERARRWNDAVTTGLFLRLERGRIYATLGMLEEAVADFRLVRNGQLEDTSYPRLGALRDLAGTLRRLGKIEEADDFLRACLNVARVERHPVLRKVGAIAAGEALLSPLQTHVPRSDLEQAWIGAFGGDAAASQMASVVRAWIY